MQNPEMNGEEFRALRERIGSAIDVAEIFGVHRVTISKWEREIQPIPGPARALVRILADREADKLARLEDLEQQKKEILNAK